MTQFDTAVAEADEGIDPALFRETLGHYPTGVAVVTGIAEDGAPAGMVVGSFTSVSLDPPLVAFLPTRESGSFARLRTGEHLLRQRPRRRPGADLPPLRLPRTGQVRGRGLVARARAGRPSWTGRSSWIECTYQDVIEGGDHYIVLGRGPLTCRWPGPRCRCSSSRAATGASPLRRSSRRRTPTSSRRCGWPSWRAARHRAS